MGIKNIHIVLITASIGLAVLFGLWAITHDYNGLGYASLITAVALVIYGISFLKKLKA